MLAFIKDYRFEKIKKKLLLIYLLNITDIIFTLILLNTGFFKELNIFMASALQNKIAGLALKAILPAILLFYLYIRMQKATDKQLKKSNSILNLAGLVYALINISHIVWFVILPFFYIGSVITNS